MVDILKIDSRGFPGGFNVRLREKRVSDVSQSFSREQMEGLS